MTTTTPISLGWTLAEWSQAYTGGASAIGLLNDLLAYITEQETDNGALKTGSAWISLVTEAQLQAQLQDLEARQQRGDELPLFGVPFAVKDNIDAAGLPTTAACPEFAYTPEQDAQVVSLLKAAGAVVMGKTNLDQFATGLVGTRSPEN